MSKDIEHRALLDRYDMAHPPGQRIIRLSVRMSDWQWYAATEKGQFSAHKDFQGGEWGRLVHPHWNDLPT